jgi:NAD(P) transhydrogenase subunit alpha
MKIGVPREIGPGDRRVAIVPESARQLKAAGAEILVEAGAGVGAFTPIRRTGRDASIVSDSTSLWSDADVVVKIQPHFEFRHGPPRGRGSRARRVLVCMLRPLSNLDVVRTGHAAVSSLAWT